MTTLKQALEAGKLDRFIAEHSDDDGDDDAFNATLVSMAGRRKQFQKGPVRTEGQTAAAGTFPRYAAQ